MSVTDFERNDDLDGLTPVELEARAFGPERRSLRGLLARRPGALPTPPPAADGRRRRRVLTVAALAVGLLGAGAVVALTSGHPAPHRHDGFVYHDDFGTYERIEDSHVYQETDEFELGDGEVLDEVEDVFFDDGEFDGGEILEVEDVFDDGEVVDL